MIIFSIDGKVNTFFLNCLLFYVKLYITKATKPEEAGDYYAWGETKAKIYFDSNTYKWNNVSTSSLQSQGIIDTNGNLSSYYDAATQNWGMNWRMPTSAEMKELETKCKWTWTTLNGVNGYQVVGPNGNSIFMPALGGRGRSDVYDGGAYGFYWSSSVHENVNSYMTYLSSDSFGQSSDERYYGDNVRPVTEK